jgi:hypothetical protein
MSVAPVHGDKSGRSLHGVEFPLNDSLISAPISIRLGLHLRC